MINGKMTQEQLKHSKQLATKIIAIIDTRRYVCYTTDKQTGETTSIIQAYPGLRSDHLKMMMQVVLDHPGFSQAKPQHTKAKPKKKAKKVKKLKPSEERNVLDYAFPNPVV